MELWSLVVGMGLHILMESSHFISTHIYYSGYIMNLLCCQVWAKCYEGGNKFETKSLLSR